MSQSTWISAFERDEQAEGRLGKHSHGQLSLKEICPSPSAFWMFSPALNSEVGRNFLFLLRNSEAMEVGDQSGPGWDIVAWYGLFEPGVSPS